MVSSAVTRVVRAFASGAVSAVRLADAGVGSALAAPVPAPVLLSAGMATSRRAGHAAACTPAACAGTGPAAMITEQPRMAMVLMYVSALTAVSGPCIAR